MIIIGVTGPSGSGKSLFCNILKQHGRVIDCDALYHSMLAQDRDLREALAAAFGENILTPEGIHRKALASIVFADGGKLALLNSVTHPRVGAKVREILSDAEKSGSPLCGIDAPQLYESGLDSLCDKVFCVYAPPEERTRRIALRDGLTPEEAERRTGAQKKEEYYLRQGAEVLRNDGTPGEFESKAREALRSVSGLSSVIL